MWSKVCRSGVMLTVRRSICMELVSSGCVGSGVVTEALLARGVQTPVPFVLGAALGGAGQSAFRRRDALRGAELIELRTWHQHLDEEPWLAHGELELDETVRTRIDDAHPANGGVEDGSGSGGHGGSGCGGWCCARCLASRLPGISLCPQNLEISRVNTRTT